MSFILNIKGGCDPGGGGGGGDEGKIHYCDITCNYFSIHFNKMRRCWRWFRRVLDW